MYAREIEGREFTFGVSGKLIRNVLVMYDRQTESYWSQLLGEAVEGDLEGTKLEFLPSWHTTCKQWKEMHPETQALRKGFGGGRDPYGGYYQSGSAGVIGETIHDDRLFTKELVVGVELDETTIAYPYRALNIEPVINDVVGGQDLLITFDVNSSTGVVFDRKLNDQLLSFELVDSETLTLADVETNSTWDGFSGLATSGPLAGQSLDRIKSTAVFWFGWKDFHSDTLVYGVDHGIEG